MKGMMRSQSTLFSSSTAASVYDELMNHLPTPRPIVANSPRLTAGADAGADAAVDVGTDAATDVDTDAGTDAAVDAPTDAGADVVLAASTEGLALGVV